MLREERAWFKSKEEEAEREVRRSINPENYQDPDIYDHFMDETGIFWDGTLGSLPS